MSAHPQQVKENITKDGVSRSQTVNIQNISATTAYQHKSQEELRFEDYKRNNKGPGSGGSGIGAFGATGTGNTMGAFGGATGAPLFGAGATTGSSAFGQPQQQPAAGGFGGFGTTSGFGTTTGAAGMGTSQFGTNAFGAQPTTGTTTGFGGFGQQQQQQQQKPAFGTGAFGTSGFGAPAATTGAFGTQPQQQQQQQPGATAFGAPGAFGTTAGTTGTGAFGTTGMFGSQAAGNGATSTSTGGFGFGSGTGGFGTGTTGGAFGTTTPGTTGAAGSSTNPTFQFGNTGANTTGAFGTSTTGGFGNLGQKSPGTTGATTGFGTFGGGGFGGFGGFGNTSGTGGATTSGFGGFGSTTGAGAGAGTGGFKLGGTTGGFGTPSTTGNNMFSGFGGTSGIGTGATGFGTGATGFGTGTSGFGGFGTSGFGGYGGAASGAAGSTTGANPLQQVQQMNPQQQQELLQQLTVAIQQQQQQQLGKGSDPLADVAAKLELLKKKKDDIDMAAQVAKAEAAAAAAADEKPPPNLFAGFSGAKPVPSYRASPRSTARVTPRGLLRGGGAAYAASSPARNGNNDSASASGSSSSSSSSATATRMAANRAENLLSPAQSSASTAARNAKRLIVPSFTSPIPDPTSELPPVPSSTASKSQQVRPPGTGAGAEAGAGAASGGDNDTRGSSRQDHRTPSKIGTSDDGDGGHMTASAGPSSSAGAGTGGGRGAPMSTTKAVGSEATGLTPAAAHTPYHASSASTSASGTGLAASSATRNHQKGSTTPISFRLSSPDEAGRSTGQGSRGSAGPHNRQSNNSRRAEDEDGVNDDDDEEEDLAPVLKRPGYFTSPDINVLQHMSEEELARVKNFTVFRPNVGKIEWAGETDVRFLNLDEIVKIEHKEVFVYEESATISPPEVGVGLNKPAVVTLCNVFPKEGSSLKKKQDFQQKLIDFCLLNDAEMLDYDSQTGNWVFAVKHFSRYGLDDSDDDEDDDGNDSSLPHGAAGAAVSEAKKIQPTTSVGIPDGKPTRATAPLTGPGESGSGSEETKGAVENVSANIQRLRRILTRTQKPHASDPYFANTGAGAGFGEGGVDADGIGDDAAEAMTIDAASDSASKPIRVGSLGDSYRSSILGRSMGATTNSDMVRIMTATAMTGRRERGQNTSHGSPLWASSTSTDEVEELDELPPSSRRRTQAPPPVQEQQQSQQPIGARSISSVHQVVQLMSLPLTSLDDVYAAVQGSNERRATTNATGSSPNPFSRSASNGTTNTDAATLRLQAKARSLDAYQRPVDSPCMQIMLQVKQRAATETGVAMPAAVSDAMLMNQTFTQAGLPASERVASGGTSQRSMRNFTQTMGRSFRVGWSADGRIIHPGKIAFAADGSVGRTHRITVERVDPLRWSKLQQQQRSQLQEEEQQQPGDEIGRYEGALRVILAASHHQFDPVTHSGSLKMPLWSTPSADPTQLHEYVPFLKMLKGLAAVFKTSTQSLNRGEEGSTSSSESHHHPDWAICKALELVDAACGQERAEFSADPAVRAMEIMPQWESTVSQTVTELPEPELVERRRTALSNWLASVSHPEGRCSMLPSFSHANQYAYH